ncbi:MAG: hypothetical protein WCD18_25935 [Thermosynechococcaceae cyanobacterium]
MKTLILSVAVFFSLNPQSAGQADNHQPSPNTRQSTKITYQPPITITKGGTYSGNWQSLDASIPAVSIRTTEPVIIENCTIRSRGHLITTRFSDRDAQTGTNVTVRNCRGYGLKSQVSGKAPGFFFLTVYPKRVVLENNYWEHTRGAVAIGDNTFRNVSEIRVNRNRVANVDGRTSNGARCDTSKNDIPFVTANGMCGAGFVVINGFLKVAKIEVAWNEVINQPYNSHAEDMVNIYNSSGTATTPIQIHDNYIQGVYPANPAKDGCTGSGINAGDGDSEVDAAHAAAFVHAFNNQVVSSANVGIFIAAGHDSRLYGNRVVSSGYLPGNKKIANHFTGMYVWDCCYGQTKKNPPVFFNNWAYDNAIGYAWVTKNGQQIRDDTYFPDCAKTSGGETRCVRNRSLPNPITRATEQAEYQRWKQKVLSSGIVIGPT